MDLGRLAAGVLYRAEPETPPAAFAAAELRRYLARLFGTAPVERRVAIPAGVLVLALPEAVHSAAVRLPAAGAEWSVVPDAGGVTITARRPRGLVAAVYALLEAVGCEWSPDGRERLPVGQPAAVPAIDGRYAFARRAWASDLGTWHYGVPSRLAERLPSDVAFIDWIAKRGATGFLFIRAANDTQWSVSELVPELERRGLRLELGGHVLTELLPRALFAAHPEYFPMVDGARTDLGNLCPSSGALAVVADTAREAFTAATDVHLWGLDAFGGGWCGCERCRALTPSDQALLVSNAVAEALGDARVFHLAYHDTLAPPSRVHPHPHVVAEFAPRERCYAHAFDDVACATNRRHRAAFEQHLECFAGRVHVFEYYGDAILFGGCGVPLVDVCAADLAYYRRAGARGVSCLTFGRYSVFAHGANLEAFAHGAVDPAAARTARTVHGARFGAGAAEMGRYVAALEAAMAGVVTYGDVKLPPARDAVRDALDRTLAAVPALRDLVRDAVVAGGPSARLAAEAALLEYTAATLGALRRWVHAVLEDPRGADVERAIAALGEAVALLGDVPLDVKGTWGAYDLEVANAFYAATLATRRPAGC